MGSMAAETKKREARRSPPPIERLPSTIYAELRRIAQRLMRGENAGHTLQTTALVHEAFLRLAPHAELRPEQTTHMRAAFAQAMRHILVDHARRKHARKRGGERVKVALDERLATAKGEADLLELHELLEKLAELDPAQAQLVELRIFGGMTVAEAAAEMGLSKRSAERDW